MCGLCAPRRVHRVRCLVLGANSSSGCQVPGARKQKERGDKRVLPCVALPHVGPGRPRRAMGWASKTGYLSPCTVLPDRYQTKRYLATPAPCSPIVHGPYAPGSGRALWDIPGRMNAVAKPGHMFLRATLGTTNKPQESGRRDVERRDRGRRARLSDSVPPKEKRPGLCHSFATTREYSPECNPPPKLHHLDAPRLWCEKQSPTQDRTHDMAVTAVVTAASTNILCCCSLMLIDAMLLVWSNETRC